MKQFAIIGLDSFGVWILDELLELDVEVLIVDKNETLVSQYRNRVQAAYVADVIKEETIRKIVPEDIDAAIIDLGDRTQSSVLVANYLKKMGVRKIIAKAETDEHGEILRLVGATDVVVPDREAAKRIMPPLLSESMFSYMPISDRLVMAEVRFPEHMDGKSLAESDVRREHGLNVVAVRPGGAGQFVFVSPAYRIAVADTFLVVGETATVQGFSLNHEASGQSEGFFRRLFRGRTAPAQGQESDET